MWLIEEFNADFENKNSISLNLMFKGKRGSRLLRDDKFRLPSQLCTKRKKKKFKRLFSKRGHSDISINYLECSTFGRNSSWLILQLTVESRSLSQAEKKYCSCKLSKFTKWQLFSLKMVLGQNFVKKVAIFWVSQLVTTVFFFSAWNKSCDATVNWRNLDQM